MNNRLDVTILGQGKDVVILGGASTVSSELVNLIKVNSNLRYIIPSLPGFGYSNQILGNNLDDYSDWLSDIIIENVKQNKFTIIANSMSAAIAIKYASEHESRINKLVLVSPLMAPITINLKLFVDTLKFNAWYFSSIENINVFKRFKPMGLISIAKFVGGFQLSINSKLKIDTKVHISKKDQIVSFTNQLMVKNFIEETDLSIKIHEEADHSLFLKNMNEFLLDLIE